MSEKICMSVMWCQTRISCPTRSACLTQLHRCPHVLSQKLTQRLSHRTSVCRFCFVRLVTHRIAGTGSNKIKNILKTVKDRNKFGLSILNQIWSEVVLSRSAVDLQAFFPRNELKVLKRWNQLKRAVSSMRQLVARNVHVILSSACFYTHSGARLK